MNKLTSKLVKGASKVVSASSRRKTAPPFCLGVIYQPKRPQAAKKH